ncbi:MAG: hypothetical protein ACRDGU_10835 [Actinomycetota bacterium]
MKTKRTIRPRFAIPLLALLILLAMMPAGQAEDNEIPDWIGKLVLATTDLGPLSNPESTQEELPGLGHKFELLFAMLDDQDPQNPTNDTISVVTTMAYPAGIGVAFRNTPPGFKIGALDHQINLKYFFPMAPRTCSGGSPRIQVAIDTDGDGDFDANAFGYVGHAPFGTGCITGEWDIIDMTDNIGRWDLSQLGGGMTMTWDTAEAFIMTGFPNHRVISGSLVDDSCSFAPTSCGEAHYDLFTYENRTLENDQDTV